jgi:hypothetical protein
VIPLVLATTIAALPTWESFNASRNASKDKNQDTECHSPNHSMHIGVRHTEANGVGYTDGYTTLEGFGIYNKNACFMPFLDLRGHVFNNGKLAGNIGIGSRSVIPQMNHMLGFYFYYDVRQESRGMNVVNQVSPGMELLGKRFEYRMNGYIPVGNRRSNKYGYEFNKFDGNNILLRYKQKFVLKGGDAEVGLHLTQSTKYDLYTGVGPYYFSAGGSHGWGVKTRLLARYKEYISLEGSYSYDRVFHNIVQGTIGFNCPFGAKLRRKDRNCPQQNDLMLSRASFAPYRFEIPVVKKIKKSALAINPATGQPWQVWFVNNTSSSAGTFQSPFPTLAQAQSASSPNDMIYVFPGDGTTTGMDMGITLQAGQKLFGSSIAHKIATTNGNVTIPAFSTSAPMLTNAGSIVTLANGNEVSGLQLAVTQLDSTAIIGAAGTNGANIHDNVLSGAVHYAGINIVGQGTVTIINNQLTGPLSNTDQAIRLTVSPSLNMNATVDYNQISGFGDGIGMNYGLNSTATADISYNTLTNLTTGASTSIFNQTASGASGTGTIVGNQISSNAFNAILVGATGANPSSMQIFIADNNLILGPLATATAINVTSTGSGTTCATITGNQITLQNAAVTTGISLTTTGGGIINIEDASDNNIPQINVTGVNINYVMPNTCSQ